VQQKAQACHNRNTKQLNTLAHYQQPAYAVQQCFSTSILQTFHKW